MERVRAVRGAVLIGENTAAAIEEGTAHMMRRLMETNGLKEERLVSVQFTVTGDLTAANPATAFRHLGYSRTPLFCSLEPSFDGAMKGVVRVLVTAFADGERELQPVYVQGAEKLRPDVAGTGGSHSGTGGGGNKSNASSGPGGGGA